MAEKFNLNFDLSDLNELDLENIGSWPFVIKAIFASIIAVFVGFLVYYFVIADQLTHLERAEAEELELKNKYSVKYQIAINVDSYREQMVEIEKQFQSMLKQLPSEHETAALLDDITYVGTANGLQFDKLEWQKEKHQEFYIELPMVVEVVGKYHQLGQFVSDVAGLSRIVSLHDFKLLHLQGEEDVLHMSVQASTYRYKEGENVAEQQKETGG